MLTARIPVFHRVCSLKTSSAIFAIPEFNDPIKDKAESMVARQKLEPNKQRVQSWTKPIYYAPHQHVFEQSPDFSFKDGRSCHVTSKKQLDYKLDQIRLTKKIIELLKETDEVEAVYKKEMESRKKIEQELEEKRPKMKGTTSIC